MEEGFFSWALAPCSSCLSMQVTGPKGGNYCDWVLVTQMRELDDSLSAPIFKPALAIVNIYRMNQCLKGFVSLSVSLSHSLTSPSLSPSLSSQAHTNMHLKKKSFKNCAWKIVIKYEKISWNNCWHAEFIRIPGTCIVAQLVKAMHVMSLPHSRAASSVPAALLLIQLPDNVHGKAVEDFFAKHLGPCLPCRWPVRKSTIPSS